MKKTKLLAASICAMAAFQSFAAAQTNPKGTAGIGDAYAGIKLLGTESPEAIAKRLQWWGDARLGMFIRWGRRSDL